MTRPARTLEGMHVVIARTERAMEATIAVFETRGARVTPAMTATRTGPLDDGRTLAEALTRPPVGWLAFASASAVAAVADLLADAAADPETDGDGETEPDRWRCAAVGPSTALAAAQAGLHVEVTADPATARRLVELLADLDVERLVAPVVENEPSPLAAALAASSLADRCEVVPAYRSEPADLGGLTAQIEYADLVVAFAPSAVRRLAEAGRPRHLLAIGPTTAEPAAAWLGSDAVTVAADHDLEGVIRAAEQWWAARNDLGSAP